MGKEGVSKTPEGHDARREEGKRRADALRAEYLESGDPFGWFDACYKEADGERHEDPARDATTPAAQVDFPHSTASTGMCPH